MPDRRCRLLPMGKRDPRVDTYIAKAGDFARPILKHLRELVHKACAEFPGRDQMEQTMLHLPRRNFMRNGCVQGALLFQLLGC